MTSAGGRRGNPKGRWRDDANHSARLIAAGAPRHQAAHRTGTSRSSPLRCVTSRDAPLLAEILFGTLLGGLVVAGVYTRAGRRPPDAQAPGGIAREDWTMPPPELLQRPEWSRARTVGMCALRGYLVLAVVMLIVKAIEVGLGH